MENMGVNSKKTVLITGGTGFLGSRIVKLFLEDDQYKLIILKRKNSKLAKINKFVLQNKPEFIDIEDGSLAEIFQKENIDFIIHTATCYGRNKEADQDIYHVNYDLPKNLLGLGIKNGLKAFINADTFFNEKIKFTGNESAYVKSKKEFLENAKKVTKDSKTKLINLVIFQMYGPDDHDHKFIPFIIKKLRAGKSIDLTPGEQKRDFIYVDDVAQAFASVIKNIDSLENFGQFEIGSGHSKSIKKVVEVLKREIKSKSNLNWGALPYRENEIMNSVADIKNNTKTNWKAKTSLDDGLQKILE